MRKLIGCVLAAAFVLGGCASKPAAAPLQTKQVKVDASNIAEAQAAGYKVVDENGKTMFCRKEPVTGSHVRFRTSCLTAQEWEQLSKDNREAVNNMSHRVQPPNPLLK
jgi:hypothetical protein